MPIAASWRLEEREGSVDHSSPAGPAGPRAAAPAGASWQQQGCSRRAAAAAGGLAVEAALGETAACRADRVAGVLNRAIPVAIARGNPA